ncbi:MAG: YihY/virulence factor BrkB family protein, partial [Terriglobales bacterium]
MLRYLTLLRRSFWRAFQHGVFMNAKGAAYSSILTVFPALIVIAWLLDRTDTTSTFLAEISYALGVVLPPGARSQAVEYFTHNQQRPVKEIVSASFIMIMAASGIMISWMAGFRAAYAISENPWGFWRERAVALFLVLLGIAPMAFAMGLVAFGNVIESWLVLQMTWVPKLYILLLWSLGRWALAGLTSLTVIMLIYHWGLPRV